MKRYVLIADGNPFTETKIIEAANYKDARLKAFQWSCVISGDRLYDVKILEVKGELNLSGELNPHPRSAMYFSADLDYETGKRRTRERKRVIREQQKRLCLKELQKKLDTNDEMVVPYAEMTYKMKFISKEELDAIRERFEGEEK